MKLYWHPAMQVMYKVVLVLFIDAAFYTFLIELFLKGRFEKEAFELRKVVIKFFQSEKLIS
jgi:hypothetical protein